MASPLQSALGTKRTLSLLSSSRACVASSVELILDHEPLPSLNCQAPFVLLIAVIAIASGAEVLGVTESRVCQIHARVMTALKARFGSSLAL